MVNLSVTLSFYGIWVATVVAVLAVVGFPIEALLTFAGVTIVILGLALQQSIKDFATAVIFVLFKPFEVGDLIQTKGITGTVQEMQFFNTVLLQGDKGGDPPERRGSTEWHHQLHQDGHPTRRFGLRHRLR